MPKQTLKEQNWEKRFDKEFPRQHASPEELEDWFWAEKQDIKSFIRILLKEEKSIAYKKGWDDYREKVDNYEKNNL